MQITDAPWGPAIVSGDEGVFYEFGGRIRLQMDAVIGHREAALDWLETAERTGLRPVDPEDPASSFEFVPYDDGASRAAWCLLECRERAVRCVLGICGTMTQGLELPVDWQGTALLPQRRPERNLQAVVPYPRPTFPTRVVLGWP